ncbi:MAG: ROK family protein [Betaproteobacteria bacterium]|nr:ROK family protein [Betaproteobacteria bacterium]
MRIGIDLGGTKIEIIALDDDGGELLRHRVATPQGDYTATVQAIAALVEQTENRLQHKGSIGIGIPGAPSMVSGLIKNANSTCLIGKPLQNDLQQALCREVRLANDANCFALSEASDGAGVGADVVFGVILGTGVGGGIVVHGRVLTGCNAIAGEWGHNPLPGLSEHPQPACYCGRSGCIETYLSGPGMSQDHFCHNRASLASPDIVAGAEAGDATCEATLRRYESRLATALAGIINILDPDVVVLGGGLSNIDRLYVNVPRLWEEHVFSDHVVTRLVRNRHGDSSGVRGAAWLWERTA